MYQFEDELFELLGRAKKKEIPVDAAGLLAILVVPGALVVVGLARLLHLGDSVWTFLIASFVLMAVVTRPVMIVRQREWR